MKGIKPHTHAQRVEIIETGSYQNLGQLQKTVREIFSELEMILENKGLQLYNEKLY